MSRAGCYGKERQIRTENPASPRPVAKHLKLYVENLSFCLVIANGHSWFLASSSCKCNPLLRNLPGYIGQYGKRRRGRYTLRIEVSLLHISPSWLYTACHASSACCSSIGFRGCCCGAHQQPFLLRFFGSGAPGLLGRGIPRNGRGLVCRRCRPLPVALLLAGQLKRG